MYFFILWMCLTSQPDCKFYHAVGNKVMIFAEQNRAACEDQWKESLLSPDPDGMVSRHLCQAQSEEL